MNQKEFETQWIPLNSAFYRLAKSILKSESDAQDAVQDVYVKLWNSRHSLDKITAPKEYGLVLVKNLCIDRLRQKKYYENIDNVTVIEDCDKSDESYNRETVKKMKTAMSFLPEDMRELVEMRFVHNLDYEDIADKTGLSPGNVRVRISRARKKIVTWMKKQQ